MRGQIGFGPGDSSIHVLKDWVDGAPFLSPCELVKEKVGPVSDLPLFLPKGSSDLIYQSKMYPWCLTVHSIEVVLDLKCGMWPLHVFLAYLLVIPLWLI